MTKPTTFEWHTDRIGRHVLKTTLPNGCTVSTVPVRLVKLGLNKQHLTEPGYESVLLDGQRPVDLHDGQTTIRSTDRALAEAMHHAMVDRFWGEEPEVSDA